MIRINYHNITHDDMNNGSGLRVVLWLSGCSHHCFNCQNPQTWNPDSGILFDKSAKEEIFEELSKPYISGVTFSGGDPLYKLNLNELCELTHEINISFPEKTIWLYTGYTFDELKRKHNEYKYTPFDPIADKWLTRWEIISMCNVLVDGEYIDAERDITKKWAGSKNQRVINVKESIKKNEIVLYCD